MCSSAYRTETQGIEVILRTKRIDDAVTTTNCNVEKVSSYKTLLSSYSTSTIEKEVKLEAKFKKLFFTQTTSARVMKRESSKRIRDVNGYRQRAAALCLRRAVVEKVNTDGIDKSLVRLSKNVSRTVCQSSKEDSLMKETSELEILLVSGRGQKNYWVLPGGGVEKEESTEQAVLREFKEEAGIQGSITAVLGEFKDDERYHRTTLFMLSVLEVFDKWEDFESGRRRRWMSVKEALANIKKSQIAMVENSLTAAMEILKKNEAENDQ